MRSRAVRSSLTLLAVAAIAAGAYFTWTIEAQEVERRQAVEAFEQARATALRDAHELRASQQAYVAAGQSETFWFSKVAELIDSLGVSLAAMDSASAAEAREAIGRARKAVQGFEQVDRRARTYASTGQRLLASDIIFSDGLNASLKITTALEEAGAAESRHALQEATAARVEQLMPIAAATGSVLLVLLLLTPVARVEAPRAAPAAAEPVPAPDPASDLELKPRIQNESRRPRETLAPSTPPAAPVTAPAPVEMQRLASVCTDLARLSDTDHLPSILERTAQAIDASGLVLWVANSDGVELAPVAAHGYPAAVLSRLGTIRSDAENVTAAAFRTGLLQTVGGGNGTGAIAAPLVTADGCRGVMSAEVAYDAGKQPARLAAASIVAAQLATLVGPSPTPAASDHEAAI